MATIVEQSSPTDHPKIDIQKGPFYRRDQKTYGGARKVTSAAEQRHGLN